MNREMRRLQQKEEERAKRRRQQGPRRDRRERTRPRQYLREVRQELKKVAWPSRQQTVTYTVAVLVATVFVTGLTFGMDVVFKEGVLRLLDQV